MKDNDGSLRVGAYALTDDGDRVKVLDLLRMETWMCAEIEEEDGNVDYVDVVYLRPITE